MLLTLFSVYIWCGYLLLDRPSIIRYILEVPLKDTDTQLRRQYCLTKKLRHSQNSYGEWNHELYKFYQNLCDQTFFMGRETHEIKFHLCTILVQQLSNHLCMCTVATCSKCIKYHACEHNYVCLNIVTSQTTYQCILQLLVDGKKFSR